MAESRDMPRHRVVAVLGGSSGIGQATAVRFALEGWRVAVASNDERACRSTMALLAGEGHCAFRCDVSNPDDCREFAEALQAMYGSLDALVNSVGISRSNAVLDSNYQKWKEPLDVMLHGAVFAARALVPLIRDGGRIIHITSIHDSRVAVGSSAYGMAKAAVTQLVKALAIELAPRGILSNAIAPGFIDTPMSVKEDGENELESDWFRQVYVEGGRLPLRRPGKPEEIAGIASFLAGPDASYITGAVIIADGGLVLSF